jgi:hypothetical protein
MQIIKNNPYRQLGLLVGAKAAQLNKHTTQIPMYLDAEQPIPDKFIEYGFNSLGRIERTQSSISSAAAKLSLNQDRIEAALFWFYNSNSKYDIEAIDFLKAGQPSDALKVWLELAKVNNIKPINISAFQNASTLSLLIVFASKTLNEERLKEALELKMKFIESDYIYDFVALATDVNYKPSKNELQLIILNQIRAEIERTKIISFHKTIEIINTLNFSAKDDFFSDCLLKLIAEIERQIEEAKTKRKINKSDAINIGNDLLNESENNLTLIRTISGNSNLRLISISDKLSEEILQCGIDYYKYNKQLNKYPVEDIMSIFKAAISLAIGNVVKQRCQENIDFLQDLINDPYNSIKEELEYLYKKLSDFDKLPKTNANAKELIISCIPKLQTIKERIGDEESYLNISSAIVFNAQNMLVAVINDAQECYSKRDLYSIEPFRFPSFSDGQIVMKESILGYQLRKVANDALEVTKLMSSMDMNDNLKESFMKNSEVLEKIIRLVSPPKPKPAPTPTPVSLPPKKFDLFVNFIKKTPNWSRWIFGVLVFIALIALTFGLDGLKTIGYIIGFLGSWILISFTRRRRY